MVRRGEKHKTVALTIRFHRWLRRHKRRGGDRTLEATLKRLTGDG